MAIDDNDIKKLKTIFATKDDLKKFATKKESEKIAQGIDSKIEIIYKTNIKSIEGENFVEKITLDKEYEGSNELSVNGIFIEVGSAPSTAIYKPLGVKTEDGGLIVVDSAQKTSVNGIWAAGDITTGSNKLRQVITAAAEGAIAIHDIYQTIKKSKK